jgi:putative transposase
MSWRDVWFWAKEDRSGWSAFLRHLVDRGFKGVALITSDAYRGLIEMIAPRSIYPRRAGNGV